MIDATLSALPEDEELTAARSLLQGRERQWSSLDPAVKKRRAFGLLQRRGFSAKVVRQVMAELA